MTDEHLTYTPGNWAGLAASGLWGLVLIELHDSRLFDLWDASNQGVDEVLDTLARQGLRSLPGFAIVGRDGATLRYAVRGPAELLFDGAHVVSTSGGPWFEGRVPDGVTHVRLSAPEQPGAIVLPTRGGITSISSLVIDLGEASVAAVEAPTPGLGPEAAERPASDSEPEPAAEIAASITALPDDANLSIEDPHEDQPHVARVEGTADDTSSLAADSNDQSAAYYQLLVSSTIDLDTLRARLNDGPDALIGQDSPTSPDVAVGETVVWDDHELDTAARAGEAIDEESTESPALSTPDRDVSGLIDGVPWARDSVSSVKAEPVVAAQEPAPRDREPVLDLTAATTSRAALLAQLADESSLGPRVSAVQCGRGHLSPPYAVACRVCGAQLPDQDPQQVLRPPLGRLMLSNGSTVLLDRGVVFGRSPESPIEDPAERPHLVRLVESGEISRMHASVSLDGWQVLVRDLASQNGTFVTLPGGDPEQIRPQQDYGIEPGSVVSLAEVVSFTFELEA